MIYFDSDVLINYFVIQDEAKNKFATELYETFTQRRQLFVSLLALQKTSFVLSKLKVDNHEISRKMNNLLNLKPLDYDLTLFKRACFLAEIIGYQHINDCIHTAIAETYCQELYTFNQSDFKRIQRHTDLKITIL